MPDQNSRSPEPDVNHDKEAKEQVYIASNLAEDQVKDDNTEKPGKVAVKAAPGYNEPRVQVAGYEAVELSESPVELPAEQAALVLESPVAELA